MSELNEHLQLTHPNCYSIIHCKSRYFKSSEHIVVEDIPFLVNLILSNNIKELDFMESFYQEIKEKQQSYKDIMSRNRCFSLEDINEENILSFDEIKREKRTILTRSIKK